MIRRVRVSEILQNNNQKNITAQSGQNVTLTCRAPNNNIIAVEWSRADLKEDEYLFLYRYGNFVPDYQHPSFKNRVDLQDRQMKDGDVSLILKDVTINDTGTYECRVFMSGPNNDPIIIHLRVDPPGQTGGHTEDGGKEDGGKEAGGEKSRSVGLIVGLSVVVFLVVAVVVVVIYRQYKQQSQDSHRSNAEPKTKMSESFLNSESSAAEHKDK